MGSQLTLISQYFYQYHLVSSTYMQWIQQSQLQKARTRKQKLSEGIRTWDQMVTFHNFICFLSSYLFNLCFLLICSFFPSRNCLICFWQKTRILLPTKNFCFSSISYFHINDSRCFYPHLFISLSFTSFPLTSPLFCFYICLWLNYYSQFKSR